jgi:hypothetical protein
MRVDPTFEHIKGIDLWQHTMPTHLQHMNVGCPHVTKLNDKYNME